MLEELARSLDLRALRSELATLKRPVDWEKQQEIKARYFKQTSQQTRRYEQDYEQRVDMVATHIAKSKGVRFEALKARKDPHGKYLTNRVLIKARREVEHDHNRRITALQVSQVKELRALVDTARERELARSQERNPGPEAPTSVRQPTPPKQITDERSKTRRCMFTRSR